MQNKINTGLRHTIHKWTNYEYWPWWVLYAIMLPYFLYLAIKSRSLTFFSNVNPGLEYSGFKNYSKFQVLNTLPERFLPQSFLKNVLDFPKPSVQFPLILKPNKGQRGAGVKIIRSQEEYKQYFDDFHQDVIEQEFVDYPYEATVFYIKYPDHKSGMITSLTTKEFLTVSGDGIRSIREHMERSHRAIDQIARYDSSFLNAVPSKGEQVIIEPIGNHCRGTKFINAHSEISPSMVSVFDDITKDMVDFHYGRFDLKYEHQDSLVSGVGIKIVELNGVSADPAHIFDQSVGLFSSLGAIAKHWQHLYNISAIQKSRGIQPVGLVELYQQSYSRSNQTSNLVKKAVYTTQYN